jgi:uncharacterized SAM-binding protein YcdF (DUF218 family)
MIGIHAEPLIVVLGAPNDAMGALLSVAMSRLETAVRVHRDHPSSPILPTGGYGAHFNTSSEPHFSNMARELVSRGVDQASILRGVLSANTVEDAVGSCERARALGVTKLVVVTSDFHGDRASLLFDREGSDLEIKFCLADSDFLDPDLLRRHEAHERSAIERLLI